MTALAFLVPVTIAMGIAGVAAFFWSLRDGQYDDLTGDAERILFDEDRPRLPKGAPSPATTTTQEPTP